MPPLGRPLNFNVLTYGRQNHGTSKSPASANPQTFLDIEALEAIISLSESVISAGR